MSLPEVLPVCLSVVVESELLLGVGDWAVAMVLTDGVYVSEGSGCGYNTSL